MHNESNLQLVDAAIKHGQRAFIGKVNITQGSIPDYVETSDENIVKTETFIKAVLERNCELVRPIITPRFALSLEMEDMKNLAALAHEYDLCIQVNVWFFYIL